MAIAAVEGNSSFSVRFFPGNRDSILVPVREIATALVTDVSYNNGWILAHSHTGASAELSIDDEKSTCVLSWLGTILEKPLVDHWIYSLSHGEFLSVMEDDPALFTPRVRFGIDGSAGR